MRPADRYRIVPREDQPKSTITNDLHRANDKFVKVDTTWNIGSSLSVAFMILVGIGLLALAGPLALPIVIPMVIYLIMLGMGK